MSAPVDRGMPAPVDPALRARERLPTRVFDDSDDASSAAASEIAALIRRCQAEGRRCVLGLATGSTPMHVYRRLVQLHRTQGLSFSHVTTFNLDEYHPMQPAALQSYRRFMQEHLFDHVDIDPGATHVPDGTLPLDQVAAHCAEYDAAIQAAGGIDLQLLGLGRGGHIGFNESGSGRGTATRLVTLARSTRVDAASDFFGLEHVPRRAITMGVGSILSSRRVLLLAFGEGKAAAAAAAVEGEPGAHCPASFLQAHPCAEAFLDAAAAAQLTRARCLWTLGAPIPWHARLVTQAAVWLAQEVGRPLLTLTEDDYAEAGLLGLLDYLGCGAEGANLLVFEALAGKITAWPAGTPPHGASDSNSGCNGSGSCGAGSGRVGSDSGGVRRGGVDRECGSGGSFGEAAAAVALNEVEIVDDSARGNLGSGISGERSARSWPKRVLVLSPHPDDDVISMGGTLIRLAEQGHEVHVAYQTSGSIAVRDQDLLARADFAAQFASVVHQAGRTTQQTRGGVTPANQRTSTLAAHQQAGSAVAAPPTSKAAAPRANGWYKLPASSEAAIPKTANEAAEAAVPPAASCATSNLAAAAGDAGAGDAALAAGEAAAAAARVRAALASKRAGEVDPPEVEAAKALLRRCEARAAAGAAGVPASRLHFLNSPFYQTGRVVKAEVGPGDVTPVITLLEQIKPHLVFAAGDLSDPHGTHRSCLRAARAALAEVAAAPWYRECGTEVLLYRGAWQEWAPHEADVIVPLTPGELRRKVRAIWAHQSQKDPPLFPGADEREFWQRAEERGRSTAAALAALGLPRHEAAEAFVRHHPSSQDRLRLGSEINPRKCGDSGPL